jgi:flagellin-like hook-associated protein FlgL
LHGAKPALGDHLSDVLLSSGARSALTSLTTFASQMDMLQKRLATGKRVNSALDNPSAYFLAKSLTDRASTLGALSDGIAAAQSTVDAASNGITAMQSLLSSAKSLGNAALQSADPTTRQSLAAQFDSLRAQIDSAAQDASYNGVNLLGGSSLTVTFNETGSSSMTLNGVALSSSSLGVAASTNDWALDSDINASLSQIDAASSSLETYATRFSANSMVLDARNDFNQSMIDTLNTGATNLTASDSNEDGAMLLALQTRQQLAITALSLVQNGQSSVLRLFANS